MKWDRVEKVYAAIMYVTETLAVLSIVGFIAYRDPYIGIVAVMLAILTATLHLMLLTYHRTRLILENLTAINNKNHTENVDKPLKALKAVTWKRLKASRIARSFYISLQTAVLESPSKTYMQVQPFKSSTPHQ